MHGINSIGVKKIAKTIYPTLSFSVMGFTEIERTTAQSTNVCNVCMHSILSYVYVCGKSWVNNLSPILFTSLPLSETWFLSWEHKNQYKSDRHSTYNCWSDVQNPYGNCLEKPHAHTRIWTHTEIERETQREKDSINDDNINDLYAAWVFLWVYSLH